MATQAQVIGIIIVALCCTTTISCQRLKEDVPKRWVELYKGLFVKYVEDVHKTPEPALEMMWMHEKLPLVQNNKAITKEMKDTFNRWYAFLSNTDVSTCNTNYLDKFRAQARDDLTNKNLRVLFRICHTNLIEICKEDYAAVTKRIDSKLDGSTRFVLRDLWNNYERLRDKLISDRTFADFLLKMLKVETTNSKTKIMDSWRNGPCGKIRQVVTASDKKIIEKFLTIVDYNRLPRDQSDFATGGATWLDVVRTCDLLDPVMPELAKYNTFGKILLKKINNISMCGSSSGEC